MTAEFELTGEDLRAFNLHHHANSPTARRQYLFGWFFPAAVWLLVCAGIWYLADQKRGTPLRTFLDLLPLFCGVPAYLVLYPFAFRRRMRKTVDAMINEGRNRDLCGPNRITISPEGVNVVRRFTQISTGWPAIERVTRNDEYAFLYVNSLSAIIVPRRAFASPQAFEEFVEASRNYQSKATI